MVKIPFWVNWIAWRDFDENIYIDCCGVIHNSRNNLSLIGSRGECCYCQLEENKDNISLVLYEACHHKTHGFYGVEKGKLSMDKYGTCSVSGECGNVMLQKNAGERLKHSAPSAYAFVGAAMERMPWLKDLEEVKVLICVKEAWEWLRLFALCGQTALKLISEYKDCPDNKNIMSYISDLLSGKEIVPITRQAIIYSYENNIRLTHAALLYNQYSHSEVQKFTKTIAHFCPKQYGIIVEALSKIRFRDFTSFANYFVKQCFILGTFRIEGEHGAREAVAWLNLYNDYINMADAIGDYGHGLYPENLKHAHDMLAEGMSSYDKKYDLQAFKKAVFMYDELAWEYKEWEVKIPQTPGDIEEEAKQMHNCLMSYTEKIINGKSKICFLWKNGKPYVDIEITEKHVKQALCSCNKYPDHETAEIIKKWAEENGLIVDRHTVM